MKRILVLSLAILMLVSISPIRAQALSLAPSSISVKNKVMEKLTYFNPVPSFTGSGTHNEINAYIYKIGEIIEGEIDEAQSSTWYVVLRDTLNTNITYSAIYSGKEFSIPASVPKDGKYKLVTTDSLTAPSWTVEKEIYIKYNVDLTLVNVKQCPNTSIIEGKITVGNNIAPFNPLDVLIVYPSLKLAAKYSISAGSSGQFSLSFVSVPDYGYYYVYISDGYPSVSPDNDAIIYYFIANFSTIQWKLTEIIPGAPLYNDEEGNLNQSIVLMLKDSNGKLISGKKNKFVVSMSWTNPTIKEISEGIYKIYGGRLSGNTVSIYIKDVIFSNTVIKNLQKLSYFNPYIEIDAEYSKAPYGTGPYYDYTLGKNVFDKLPLSNGNSLEIKAGALEIPDITDPQNKKFTMKDNYYTYKTEVILSPSLEMHKIGPDSSNIWNDPSENLFTKPVYFVKDCSNVYVSVQSIIWKRAREDSTPTWKQITPDPYNACCVYKTSETFNFTGSDVQKCDTKIDSKEFTINETKDLSISVGSSLSIIHIYMVNETGNKIGNAINISSKGGREIKTLTDLWYNPLHATGTNIPELPISFGYDDTLDIKYAGGNVIFSGVSFNAITNYPLSKNKVIIEIFKKANDTYPLCSIVDDAIKVIPITSIIEGSYEVFSTGGATTKELLAGLKESIVVYANFTFKNVFVDVKLNGKPLDTYGIGFSYLKIAEGQYKISFNKPLPYDENYSPNTLGITMEAFNNDLTVEEKLTLNINSRKVEKDNEPPQIEVFEPQENALVNTKTIKVKGIAKDNLGISNVLINGSEVVINDDGSFEQELTLEEGENLIKILAEDFSHNEKTLEVKILCDTISPSFTFDVPSETVRSEIEIKGTTEKDAKVYFRETELTNQNGNFSTKVPLSLGKNAFFFTFVDKAGNKSKTTLTIIRQEITTIVLTIGKPTMFVNSEIKEIDPGRNTIPVIKNGRTLVPIRSIIEALKGWVQWDSRERKVTITLSGKKIELWIGKNTAKIDGVETPVDPENYIVAPEIINGRTMLPLRFMVETLGCDVQWDAENKVIIITYVR